MKDPMTLTIYLQLIQDLKPKTILEFGTFDGGGALWMADMCRSLNLDTHVYTYDNNIERVKCLDERVTVINLDVTMIDSYTYNNRSFFENLPKPLLIIEDCHVNTFNICKSMDKIMKAGDYLVIEDTIDYSKHQEMIKFLENTTDYYVDRFYCDMWGNNNSWNVNSFLKKVK
jgi:cephalosporin hydroxylase